MGRFRIKKGRRDEKGRKIRMGYLIKIEKPNVLEMLWECWTLAWVYNVRPKGREAERRADRIEDKLIDASVEAELPAQLKCPSCNHRMTVQPSKHIEQAWKVDSTRTLKHAEACCCPSCAAKSPDKTKEDAVKYVPALLFYEEAEFTMLEEHVDDVSPIQPTRRAKT